MLKSFIKKQIKHLANKLLRLLIVSLSLWIFAYALPDLIDYPFIPEKLIESVYYGGKKVSKVTYEELKKNRNENDIEEMGEFNLIDNYYSNYLNNLVSNNEETQKENLKVINEKAENIDQNENIKVETKSKEKFKNTTFSYQQDQQNRAENDEKKQFSNNLYSLYGNRTIFNMNLQDLEKLVRSSVLSDSQAVIFWESLLQLKTDRAKIIFGKTQNEIDNEYYLFNFLGLKTTGLIICTVALFLITHKLQYYAIKTYFVYNFICIILTYYILANLYMWKYYLASSVMFFQFGICVKYLIDSFFSIFGFNQDDYDIFANISKTKTPTQFFLKFIASFTTTIIVGFYGLFKFQYFLNYILFYVCLIQLIYLICFFTQYDAHSIFQPFKHFLLIIIGLINFVLINFHKKISRNLTKESYDSFYIVSETFSFLCISYKYEFLLSQANLISKIFDCDQKEDKKIYQENDSSKIGGYSTNLNNTLNTPSNTSVFQKKNFTLDDSLWIIVFSMTTFISLVGVYKTRYLTYLFSMNYFKTILKVFGAVFKLKLQRCLIGFILFFLILSNHIVSSKNDFFLFDAFGINNNTTINFLKFVVRMVGLVLIILTIISNFEFIVLMNDKKNDYEEIIDDLNEQIIRKVEVSTTYEKKKRKRVKTIEIQIVKEELTPLSFMNFIYIHVDLYMNYLTICLIFFLIRDIEKNYFINIFYSILVGILILRTFFIINEFKNNTEFLYAYMICFMISVRLITITRAYSALYFVSCLYLFILILFYCMIDRKRILITILLIIHLYSACIYLVSNYLLIMMITLICLPISIAMDESKYAFSVIRFFFPGIFIMCVQLYGFKNMYSLMIGFNIQLQTILRGFDFFGFVQKIVQGNYINEFSIIENIFNYVCRIFEIKSGNSYLAGSFIL